MPRLEVEKRHCFLLLLFSFKITSIFGNKYLGLAMYTLMLADAQFRCRIREGDLKQLIATKAFKRLSKVVFGHEGVREVVTN